ncbi:pyruvate, phosphate dikinase [bacterium]|nr:pyruvate, phosphate dikinase [bacterium]
MSDPPQPSCFPVSLKYRGDSARRNTGKPGKPLAKYVYRFGGGTADGDRTMKDLLGGKGAGLAEMSRLGLNVPPGFTVSTEVCELYSKHVAAEKAGASKEVLKPVWDEMTKGVSFIEKHMSGRVFGAVSGAKGGSQPLLVSVRSGAASSMPGMMDTVLNLGLNDQILAEAITAEPKSERFLLDAYRRLLDMFGDVVLDVPHAEFELKLNGIKNEKNVKSDEELDIPALRKVINAYKQVYAARSVTFPSDPVEQLYMATEAVFASWNNERAVTYRRINKVTHLKGTAVNVQAMVFGNAGAGSCSGVCFTRNPASGEKKLYGEYLVNAQGEDVVAGIRTPQPVESMAAAGFTAARQKLDECCDTLEEHFADVMDIEFTVQDGVFFCLQCRAGKRTGRAALRIACEMVDETLISPSRALLIVEPTHVEQLLHPHFDPSDVVAPKDVCGRGLAASPGAAVGEAVFTAKGAEALAKQGRACVLLRAETSAEDVGGMHAARGIATQRGGMTSHAAVVARGWGKPAVVGCEKMTVNELGNKAVFEIVGEDGKTTELEIKQGDFVSIDGDAGIIIRRSVRLGAPPSASSRNLARVLNWADQRRTLGVLANADTPADAAAARANGAEGIGLVRTEHMFFETPARLKAVRRMTLAVDDLMLESALTEISQFQEKDFLGIFKAMDGLPVTIRLLDPPLHEFLPPSAEMSGIATEIVKDLETTGGRTRRSDELKKAIFERAASLREVNPMLGMRGCRLGISSPKITKAQCLALFRAASIAEAEGAVVFPQVMVPLVSFVAEFEHQKSIVRAAFDEVREQFPTSMFEVKIGLMIETPRATLIAAELAKPADFFSFGTNDLTQMTLGLSRDDAGPTLARYAMSGVLTSDPFAQIDTEGVGKLVELCVQSARAVNADLSLGVCGEHGGDPTSVGFFHDVGLHYVSCSPYRVVCARLAAGRAAVEKSGEGER